MGLRSYLKRTYTKIDRSVFGGRLPSGASRPAPPKPITQGTISKSTSVTISQPTSGRRTGGGGTSVIASPTAQQITTAGETIKAVPTSTTTTKPASIISREPPTTGRTITKTGKTTTGDVVRASLESIGVPIGKSASTLTDRDVSRFGKLVSTTAFGFGAGYATKSVIALAPRGVSAVTSWGLKASVPVFAGVQAVKTSMAPKGEKIHQLTYDIIRAVPATFGFAKGYQSASKRIGKVISAGTTFIPRSIYRGGLYKGKGQVQAQKIDTDVYQTDYKIDYKLPKFYQRAKQRLPKSARQTYEVIEQGDISLKHEILGLKDTTLILKGRTDFKYQPLTIVKDTGVGKIFSTTKYFEPVKTTFLTKRLKGKTAYPETIIKGKPIDVLLLKRPQKSLPFYDTSKVVLGRGSPIDTGRIRPFEGAEYKFKGQFKKDVYLGEKGYSVKLLDKKTAQLFDYDKPIGLITGAPIMGKRLRGLRDLPKPKMGKLRAEDILAVGLGRTRPIAPTRPITQPTITGTIPKEIWKPPKIGSYLKSRTRLGLTTDTRTRTRPPTVTDILTDTRVTTDVTTDVLTKIRTDTRTRTGTDVLPPARPALPPARPPIAPLAMWSILPFGGGGRGYDWNKRIKGKEVGGRFVRSFTANVLGLKAPRKRKIKRKYTGFELRI